LRLASEIIIDVGFLGVFELLFIKLELKYADLKYVDLKPKLKLFNFGFTKYFGIVGNFI
jgi:hypothetical protein